MSGYGYLLPGGMVDEDDPGHQPDEVTCKHCGEGPFTWVHTGVRWALAGDRGKLHVCTGAPGSADDFD